MSSQMQSSLGMLLVVGVGPIVGIGVGVSVGVGAGVGGDRGLGRYAAECVIAAFCGGLLDRRGGRRTENSRGNG